MIVTARKLRREMYNAARERNLSGWRSVFKLLKVNVLWKSRTERRNATSEVLAHFPRTAVAFGFIKHAIDLSEKTNKVSYPEEKVITLKYCIIIKPFVSNNEKGFLLISFENQLQAILDHGELEVMQERYHLIFIPSWTGLYSPVIFELVKRSVGHSLFVLPVHEHERDLVNGLGQNCIPLPFNAASWVNQEFFNSEANLTRDIDCLMVANFASFKRHWLLFKALKGLPESVSALCVGVPIGSRSAESIRREAEDYGVSDRVSIVENPSQEDLRLYFQRAKVFCAMSYREGSFIAVAEALMSGTPVVMFKNAHIGTKSLISPEVGALVGSISDLRDRIIEFMNFEEHGKVRYIARQSISAQANCQKLNDLLANWSLENGHQWTKDIEPFYSMRLSFYYFDENGKERLRNDYQFFEDQGIKIKLA